jgi:uncharacterized membrane protein
MENPKLRLKQQSILIGMIRALILLVFIQVIFTMVYGPIAAFLVETAQ